MKSTNGSCSDYEEFLGFGDEVLSNADEIYNAIKIINSFRSVHFVVSSPGKLILFGEHGDMFGKSAIAASINKRTRLRLLENKANYLFAINMRDIRFSYFNRFNKFIEFINKDIPGHDMKPLSKPIDNPDNINHRKFIENLKDNILNIIAPIEVNEEKLVSFCVFLYLFHGIFYKENSEVDKESHLLLPLCIDLSSDIPVGAGLGSSASFCVTIAASLLLYRNIKIHGLKLAKTITFSGKGLELISKWAFHAEKMLHGCLSGLGSAVCTYGSFVEVKNINGKTKFIDIPDPPKFEIVLINTGNKRNTIDVVGKVILNLHCFREYVEEILDGIHRVSEKASQLIKDMSNSQEGDSPDLHGYTILKELVEDNQSLLASLKVVMDDRLEEICSICLENGFSAKLTGAGEGGCAFVLLPPDYDKVAFLQCTNKLKSKGYEIGDLELGTEGVKFEDL